jgi:predicted transposase/invertase (TIGR01784 family)
MYDERRRNGELAAAIEEGMEKGMEKGREEGREEGRSEGIAEAVRKMMAAGMSVEQVCTIMGMTAEEVEKTL